MAYEMTVHYLNLEMTTQEPIIGTRKMYLGWYASDGCIETGESVFRWDEDFIEDLKYLRSMDVRGQVILRGEEGEYERYVLDDRSVKSFIGIISYNPEPDEEYGEEEEYNGKAGRRQ